MQTENAVGIEALLGQERWVRRLARALVHDGDEAEDVVQEARVASWQRPPRDPDRARAWLGIVVRNLVRNRKRAETIRQRVQAELGTEAEAAPSAERLAERLEIHRELAEAVSRLAEPFREVVLLRYYEDLSSAEIARRLGEPAGTIRWRLKIGLERLRAALDERRGARTAWLGALGPLAEADGSPAGPRAWAGAIVMALGLVAVVGVAVVLARDWKGSAGVMTGSTAAGSGSSVPQNQVRSSSGVARLAVIGADPSGAVDDVPAWIQLEGVPRQVIAGRVVSKGRPVRGARVRLSSGTLTSARHLDRHAVSKRDGAFAFPAQPITDWFLTVWAAGLEPVIHYLDLRQGTAESRVAGHPIDSLVIDLSPCRVFARGTVRDGGGGPIASARVRFSAGWDNGGTEARSDSRGRYELCIPTASPHARVLTAEASGYGAVEARPPTESGTVDFVLAPQAIVAGRASLKVSNEPVAGVDLLLHPLGAQTPGSARGERRQPARREARTDEAGRFELAGVAAGRYTLHFASDQVFGAFDEVLTIGPGDQVRGIEVGLSPVAVVDGLVLRQGTPAAHAELKFTPVPGPAGTTGPRRTRSDQQGRFRVRVPQDMQLTIETPADPARPSGRWMRALTPAAFMAGKPRRDDVRIDLPPIPPIAAVASEFVSPPGASAPPPGHVVEGRFGDQVRMLGYDVTSDRVSRGGELEVTLHFKVLAPLDGVRLFSHLIGPSGFMNLDHVPARGAHPVAEWRVGETVRDRFSIRIPSTFSPGTHTLLAGFWQPAGNRRLPISPAAQDDGESRFRVLTFTVD